MRLRFSRSQCPLLLLVPVVLLILPLAIACGSEPAQDNSSREPANSGAKASTPDSARDQSGGPVTLDRSNEVPEAAGGPQSAVEPTSPTPPTEHPTPTRRATAAPGGTPAPSVSSTRPAPSPVAPEPAIEPPSSPSAATFVSVSAGSQVLACALRTDGAVDCWYGASYYEKVMSLKGPFTAVSVGGYHACGIKPDQSIACWTPDRKEGNQHGQAEPPEGAFASVDAGFDHTCGVKTDGSAVCWGNDSEGKTRVPGGRTFQQVKANYASTCGLRPDGEVDCW